MVTIDRWNEFLSKIDFTNTTTKEKFVLKEESISRRRF